MDRTTPPHILTLVLLSGLGAMSMSAFLPSLPSMTAYFDTDYGIMQLSVSLYLAMVAVLQLIFGPLSDRFGRRSISVVAVGIFTVASLGCMVAPNIEAFLFFRMLQAVVAAGLVISRAIVRDMVPQEEAASMIGYVTMGMALIPMVAPILGGALDEAFNWQAIFLALSVAGLGVFVLCHYDLGETWQGEGKTLGEQIKDYPELLTSPRFWGYALAAAFASGAFFAFLGGAPLIASDVYGLSAVWAGVGFGAPAIGYVVGNGLSGRYSVQFGINWMIKTGILVSAAGLAVAILLVAMGYDSALMFFAFCTFVGLGNGMVIPNSSAGMLSVRPHLAGTASGLGGSLMIGGGAAMSVLAGFAMKLGGGSMPLLIIMTVTMLLALVAIIYVIRREKTLQSQ